METRWSRMQPPAHPHSPLPLLAALGAQSHRRACNLGDCGADRPRGGRAAMATGRTRLCSASGGTRAVLQHGKQGWGWHMESCRTLCRALAVRIVPLHSPPEPLWSPTHALSDPLQSPCTLQQPCAPCLPMHMPLQPPPPSSRPHSPSWHPRLSMYTPMQLPSTFSQPPSSPFLPPLPHAPALSLSSPPCTPAQTPSPPHLPNLVPSHKSLTSHCTPNT